MATAKLKRAVIGAAAKLLEDKVENVKVGDGFLYSKQFPDHRVDLERLYYVCKTEGISTAYDALFNPAVTKLDENGQGFPYATYAFGAQAAVIEVDTETGVIKVLARRLPMMLGAPSIL